MWRFCDITGGNHPVLSLLHKFYEKNTEFYEKKPCKKKKMVVVAVVVLRNKNPPPRRAFGKKARAEVETDRFSNLITCGVICVAMTAPRPRGGPLVTTDQAPHRAR